MNSLPNELQKAKDFHSHLGPYLVIGLRMGQAIVKRLGQEPFSISITCYTGSKPPLSCIVDGLQLSTPCTVGNGGIVIRDGGGVKISAVQGDRRLELSLKSAIWKQIKAVESSDELEALALRLWRLEESELLALQGEE